MSQPNAARPQRSMARPNVPQAQAKPSVKAKPPVKTKPPVQAGDSQVGRIRHLRQAAEHLAAAGYAEHAAKARQEIGRMEAELKKAAPKAPPTIDKMVSRDAPRRDLGPQTSKPQTTRLPDANAAMLNEMRKLSKQIEQLNSRMNKLESRGEPKR